VARKRRKRLPSDLPRSRVLAALRRLGFDVEREGADHTVCKDHAGGRTITVPRHSKVKRMLLRGQLRRIALSEEDFMDAY